MARSTRIKSGTVQVEGLRELNRALKQLGPDAQRELKDASKQVANFVAGDARAKALSLGSTAAHVAPSISATGGVSGAGVSFGGARYPMAGGAEFGSYKYKQFKPWRGNGPDAGYFVYPTIRDDAERIEKEFGDAMQHVINRNFPQ